MSNEQGNTEIYELAMKVRATVNAVDNFFHYIETSGNFMGTSLLARSRQSAQPNIFGFLVIKMWTRDAREVSDMPQVARRLVDAVTRDLEAFNAQAGDMRLDGVELSELSVSRVDIEELMWDGRR